MLVICVDRTCGTSRLVVIDAVPLGYRNVKFATNVPLTTNVPFVRFDEYPIVNRCKLATNIKFATIIATSIQFNTNVYECRHCMSVHIKVTFKVGRRHCD